MNIENLNASFAIAGQLEFIEGRGGLSLARIANSTAEALISVYAGQVLHYRPAGEEEDLLFVSDTAYFADGKAIKGGVPVCWPWFGADPEGKGRPAHGFVRNRQWEVIATESLRDGATMIVLGVDSSEGTRLVWDNEFELRIEITVGSTLRIDLKTTNKGTQSFDLTQALHTYFNIGDIQRTQVLGLEGGHYIDKVNGGAEKVQAGGVKIEGEVDRIYKEVSGDLIIVDATLKRRIRIRSQGSNSAVVWNPWMEIAHSMADLGDEDYRRMLCVETTNAADDVVHLAPGGTWCLGVEYAVERD